MYQYVTFAKVIYLHSEISFRRSFGKKTRLKFRKLKALQFSILFTQVRIWRTAHGVVILNTLDELLRGLTDMGIPYKGCAIKCPIKCVYDIVIYAREKFENTLCDVVQRGLNFTRKWCQLVGLTSQSARAGITYLCVTVILIERSNWGLLLTLQKP